MLRDANCDNLYLHTYQTPQIEIANVEQ
jgi:hypothetical protein